jgi:serine/threonine-protein kinase
MVDDARVRLLVEEILESERTPEEVCSDTPALLAAVRKRLEQVKRLGHQLDEMFSVDEATRRDHTPLLHADIELPAISGYEVEALLGRGGMGVVFKARHLTLNRVVALKMMLGGAHACPEELARFRREAEAVASLRHPNIVQVHDMGDHDGRPYFTMEYVEGGSLAQKLMGTPQCVSYAAALVATLAEAVQVAHQGGIIHRDLKPANILMQRKSEILASDSKVGNPNGGTASPASNLDCRISDYDPKIVDFGLARHFEKESGLTRSGARVGTPSYMAPEQAMGKTRDIGPSVDIYALGAVLYELLTGRPPFRGETPTETELQVVQHDPVPPSRLNPRVPRDLETICLKCLEKEPQKRYPSAAELAADLWRYQRGEPIAARRPSSLERLGKWVRRRPALAALLLATVLFTIALIASGQWLAVQQAHRRQAVEGALREVTDLLQRARWTDARASLQSAEARLNGGGPADLRARIEQARRDLDLVIELDRIRLSRLTSGNLQYYKHRADQDYAKAFKDAGLGQVLADPPDLVAQRVRASAVEVAVMAALDDWSICAGKERREWLLAVARTADPDPEGWRDRIRDPASWLDPKTLAELAETVPVNGPSAALLLALAERLAAADGKSTQFLKRVQRAHPADFWANMFMGNALFRSEPVEAASYYRAALASRPEAALPYTTLGDALAMQKRKDEALGYFRQALAIDPNYPRGLTNLGNWHRDAGQVEEAITYYKKALAIDANYAWAHFDLANTLRDVGRADEALEHYRQFHAIDPTISYVANIVRSDLVRRGRGEEVRRQWKKQLELDPANFDAWFGYAELCLFLENKDEYCLARADLLRKFGATMKPDVAERTSRAMLLMPAPEKELRVAVKLADMAVSAESTTPKWIYPYFLFAQGLSEYRQDHFDRAISIMNSEAANVMGPCPRLVIAMARHRLKEEQEARTMLAEVMVEFDWSMAQVRSHDQWIWHVLRREAETLIFPNTAAFLEGKYEPRDNTERLALLGVCRFKNRTYASAKLFADAFAADPKFGDDPRLSHRYHAACAAALAGTGLGDDASKLSEAERSRLRKQAFEWLAHDLAMLDKQLQGATVESHGHLIKFLKQCQTNPDFKEVREPSALAKMSLVERQEWSKLWRDVENLINRTPK